jgi:hypothetical protein
MTLKFNSIMNRPRAPVESGPSRTRGGERGAPSQSFRPAVLPSVLRTQHFGRSGMETAAKDIIAASIAGAAGIFAGQPFDT